MSNTIKQRYFTLIAVILTSVVNPALINSQRGLPETDIIDQDSSGVEKTEIPDTLKMTWFTTDHIDDLRSYADTSLDFNAIHYNPLSITGVPYLFLGTPGSSSVPMEQFRTLQSGMNFGYHQFDPYQLHLSRLKWFRTNLPFADLYFSPGKSDSEFNTSAKFTMNLNDRWNLNLEYQRLMDQGFYKDQSTKNSSLIAGLWHSSKNGKSNTFLTFLTNIHQEYNNGGILDTIYLSQEDFRANIPVTMAGSVTRHQHENFSIRNIYEPWSRPDSGRLVKPFTFQLNSLLSYEKGFFKYVDENAGSGSDSLIYRLLIRDPLGVRSYIDYRKFSAFPKITIDFPDFLRAQAGISYDLYAIGQNQLETVYRNDLKVQLEAEMNVKKFLEVKTLFDYHLLDFAGDRFFDISGTFKLDPYFQLWANQKIVYAHPAWIQKLFVLNEIQIFNNDFDQQNQYASSIGIRIPVIGLGVSLSRHTYGNYIYYTRENHFVQSSEDLSYTQITPDLKLKFAGFHLDNKLHLFYIENELYDLPEYRLESAFYFKKPILKQKMELFTGFESFITDKFYIPDYQPVLGAFTTKSDFQSDLHILINFFISFKVKDFRFFARTENLMYLIDDQVHFQVNNYPLDDFRAIRFGVRWQFVN